MSPQVQGLLSQCNAVTKEKLNCTPSPRVQGVSSQPDPSTTVPGTPAVLGVPPALTVLHPDGSAEACRLVGLDCKVFFLSCNIVIPAIIPYHFNPMQGVVVIPLSSFLSKVQDTQSLVYACP